MQVRTDYRFSLLTLSFSCSVVSFHIASPSVTPCHSVTPLSFFWFLPSPSLSLPRHCCHGISRCFITSADRQTLVHHHNYKQNEELLHRPSVRSENKPFLLQYLSNCVCCTKYEKSKQMRYLVFFFFKQLVLDLHAGQFLLMLGYFIQAPCVFPSQMSLSENIVGNILDCPASQNVY